MALRAGLLARFPRMLNLGWDEALPSGAVVFSTDAAAVLAALRRGRLHLQPRVGNTLEVESCANDPMALILTVIMIKVALSPDAIQWTLALRATPQLAIGELKAIYNSYAPARSGWKCTSSTLIRRVPDGVATLTTSPTRQPRMAVPMGARTEIRFASMSARSG